MRYIFFLCLIISGQLVCAQLLLNNPSGISLTEPTFNSKLIKENKIKSINAVFSSKPDGKVIDDKGLSASFYFDTIGRLFSFYATNISSFTKEEKYVPAGYQYGRKINDAYTSEQYFYKYDTAFTFLIYNNQNRIIIKRTFAGDFCNTWYYEYYDNGKIKKQSNYKETNAGTSRTDFRLGVQTVLSEESFEYEQPVESQVKKKCLNDEKRVYKEIIINYDNKKNIISESSQFLVGWIYIENAYQYDDKSQLIEKKYSSNANGNLQEKSAYEYDAKGNILVEKKYKNTILTNEINYLYDETNKLVKSQLNRAFTEKKIDIVKYSYTYY